MFTEFHLQILVVFSRKNLVKTEALKKGTSTASEGLHPFRPSQSSHGTLPSKNHGRKESSLICKWWKMMENDGKWWTSFANSQAQWMSIVLKCTLDISVYSVLPRFTTLQSPWHSIQKVVSMDLNSRKRPTRAKKKSKRQSCSFCANTNQRCTTLDSQHFMMRKGHQKMPNRASVQLAPPKHQKKTYIFPS